MIDLAKKNIFLVYGYFWNRVFNDKKAIDAFASAFGSDIQQNIIFRETLKDALSRLKLPSRYTVLRSLLTFREDEKTLTKLKIGEAGLKVGQPYLIGQTEEYPKYSFPWQSSDYVPFIFDRPDKPTTILIEGADYYFESQQIIFKADIFSLPFDKNIISEEDKAIKEIKAYGYCLKRDERLFADFFGNYFNMDSGDTAGFDLAVNNIWDMSVEGGTIENLNRYFGVIMSTEIPERDGIVKNIWEEADRIFIATDKEIISAPAGAVATVTLGDTVKAGENLFNTFTVYKGTDDLSFSDFPAVILEKGYLGDEYLNGLLFENKSFDTSMELYTGDPDAVILVDDAGEPLVDTSGSQPTLLIIGGGETDKGAAYIPIFPINGHPQDVETFRHRMAHYAWRYDVDMVAYDEQEGHKLNPFKFIKDHALRNNILFVKFNAAFAADGAALFRAFYFIERTIPAGTAILFYFQSSAGIDEYDVSNLAEEVGAFYAPNITENYYQYSEHINVNTRVG